MKSSDSATLDWLDSQSLDSSDLRALCFVAQQAATLATTPWAAFTRALGLTESQAKTRAAHLEKAGLCIRTVVEDPTRKGPKEIGSRYQLTTLGEQLLARLAKAFPEAVGPRFRETEQGRAGVARGLVPPTLSATPSSPSRVEPIQLHQLQRSDQDLLAKLPSALKSVVADALRTGSPMKFDSVAITAERRQLLERLLSDMRLRTTKATDAAKPVSAIAYLSPAAPALDEATGSLTRVPAAPVGEGRAACVPVIPEAKHYASVASLVLAEVRERKAYEPLRARTHQVTSVLPEIVWACVHGALADYGDRLKRVRVALRLVAEGRWSKPHGMSPAFGQDFTQNIRMAA